MLNAIRRMALFLALIIFPSVTSAQTQEWVLNYNGPGNGEDVATDVAVHDDGSVVITGRSNGGSTGLDYFTIKYDREGNLEWLQRYNGPGNGDDAASKLIIDDAGNIYVTGYSEGSGTGSDFATIKYDPSGVEQWVARYNGLNSNFPDEALAIVLDAANNVYVTGRSGSGGYFEWDYATVKYNELGTQQWASRYNGPASDWDQSNSVAVDPDGNVYVTGTFEFGDGGTAYHDYATIKYNASGVQQWIRTLDGVGHNWDEGTHIGLDDLGNVYITGFTSGLGTVYDYATVKYNPNGTQLWLTVHNTQGTPSADVPRDMIVTAQGDVYITGANSLNVGTIKYNNLGQLQWTATYNNGNFDAGYSMALDNSGNVIVTGVSSTGILESRYDYVTILYNADGQEQWVQRYNAPANNRDEAWGVAVDLSGNIYVTGSTTGTGGFDATTIRYSTQTAIECAEVTDFTARCANTETVQARATLRNNTEHVGQTLSFLIDGELYTGVITSNGTHSRAQVTARGLGDGVHVVELIDPVSCFDPIQIDCAADVAAREEAWEAEDLLWEGEIQATEQKAVNNESRLGAFPNPFNPTTTLTYHLEEGAIISLRVYDILGREVATLVDGFESAGDHSRTLDGSRLSSGTYFVRLTTPSSSLVQRILLSK